MPKLITLLSDFGTRDPYVGVMKGIISLAAPTARTVDLTADIPAQDISAGAFWLSKTFSYFPKKTAHLAVVDPGVGTLRRALAIETLGYHFVAPDNGLLSDVLRLASHAKSPIRAVQIDPAQLALLELPAPTGQTFHGRDLFAPAAALLATGVPLGELGATVASDSLVRLAPAPSQVARVRVIDTYGNLITDCPMSHAEGSQLTRDGQRLRWVKTYAEAGPGEVVALAGSWGTVEIAVNGGSAQEALGATPGMQFELALEGS